MLKKKLIAQLAILLALLLCFIPAASASSLLTNSSAGLKDTLADVLTKVGPAVVGIIGKVKDGGQYTSAGQLMPFGTGLVYKPEGYILTNSHVVSGMEDIVVVLSDGKAYNAQLKLNDEKSDLAILKIARDHLTAAEFGKSSDITIGEPVIAIGTPISFSLRNSATMGIISGVNRSADGDYKYIQSDTAINGGNSGGPLVNTQGKVIGINSSKLAGLGVEGLSFSIPVSTIEYVLDHYEKYGKVRRPFLGAKFSEGVAAMYGLPSNEGLTITEITDDSPAQAAGLAIDDVIMEMNGVKLTSLIDYNEETKKYLPGDNIEFAVDREGLQMSVTAAFGETGEETGGSSGAGDNDAAEGYALEEDGSLSDLSFLVGGIGNTEVGHSYFGWTIHVPKASQITDETFNARDVVIANQARKLTIGIRVSKNSKNRTLEEYYRWQKEQESAYGKMTDSLLHSGPDTPYAEFLYKTAYSGSILRRVLVENGNVYEVFLVSPEEVNPANMKGNAYYRGILDSFQLGYQGNINGIRDLSKVREGYVKYENYDPLKTYERLKTWQMAFKPDWKLLQADGSDLFATRFGAGDREYADISIGQLDTAQELSQYCEAIFQTYAKKYSPDHYSHIGQKAYMIGENKAYRLEYVLKTGNAQYAYNENYIAAGKLIYKIRIKSPYEGYAAQREVYDQMLHTFQPCVKDMDKLERAVEDAAVDKLSEFIGKTADLTDYQNKKLKWTVKLPGNWTKDALPHLPGSGEAFFSGDRGLAVYIVSGDRSLLRPSGKEQTDLKNIAALDITDEILADYYSFYATGSEDEDEAGADDTADGKKEEADGRLDPDLSRKSGESREKDAQTDAAAAKKFSRIENVRAKGLDITVYTYRYTDDQKEWCSDVKVYSFEKGKNIYYFATILPDYLASDYGQKLLDGIWTSFELQE